MTADNKELIAELRAYLEDFFHRLDEPARQLMRQAADALEAAERDEVDLELFRPAVESCYRKRSKNLFQAIESGKRTELVAGLRKNVEECERLFAIIDSQKDAALPAPPKKED